LIGGIKVAFAIRNGIVQKARKGEEKEDTLSFVKKLARKGERLLDVAMDMSRLYFSAVREALPHVDMVYNRCQIIAFINQGVDDGPTEEQRKLDLLGQTTLKENRFRLNSLSE
jgi:transposase